MSTSVAHPDKLSIKEQAVVVFGLVRLDDVQCWCSKVGVVMLDKRIMELETKSAYQEHTIQQLNEVIVSQQQQIDALETSMQQMREYLKSNHEQGQKEAAVDAPPPHY